MKRLCLIGLLLSIVRLEGVTSIAPFTLSPTTPLSLPSIDTKATQVIDTKDSNYKKSEFTVTAESLLAALGKELKDSSYIQDILPGNFSHCMQLLHYGQKTHQSRDYTQSVLRMFNNLLKGSDWINAYAFSHQFLTHIPTYLSDQFILYKSKHFIEQKMLFDLEIAERLQSTITNMLLSSFSSNYEAFKVDPAKFLDGISFQIAEIAREEVSIEQLRQTLIRFLETCLNKLVWSPHDKEKTWELVKNIGNQLSKLVDHNMIDSINDFDDLSWSLVHRYCYFLELASTDLSSELYEAIKRDLTSGNLAFLSIEEQEPFIESKGQKLLQTVITSQAKRMAYVNNSSTKA